MFNFLKHKNKVETPEEKALKDSLLDGVLLGYHLDAAHGGDSIASMVIALQRQGDVVNLSLRLPEGCDVEKIHHDLSQRLHVHGIREVNMNVTLSAANKPNDAQSSQSAPKGSAMSLPKTTDAMSHTQTSATTSDEPPITKKAPLQRDLPPHPRIQHIIVVASGKGGVGKSTTTVNIALALQKLGKRVGVLDADIYGPSIPAMLGVSGQQPSLENEQFVPINAHGMPMLSIGSLLSDDNTPVAWRGAKATGALMQLYNQTNWPNLDYLVIDMPPGTGDIQLTLAQRIPVTGAVIVTTPQHIALLDAQKGIEMFNKTQIPVLGVVENMALHTCSQCGHTEAIFGIGGGERMAAQYEIPLLGQLPLAKAIREQADQGAPSVLVDDEFAKYYISIAKNIDQSINQFAKPHDQNRIF